MIVSNRRASLLKKSIIHSHCPCKKKKNYQASYSLQSSKELEKSSNKECNVFENKTSHRHVKGSLAISTEKTKHIISAFMYHSDNAKIFSLDDFMQTIVWKGN